MKRIMVVGASGVLGNLICHEVLRLFNLKIQLIITDYDRERGKRLADGFGRQVQFCHFMLGDNERINQVLADVDGVVIALKQEKPLIQKACIEQGVLCVDVTPFYEFVDKVSNFCERGKCFYNRIAGFALIVQIVMHVLSTHIYQKILYTADVCFKICLTIKLLTVKIINVCITQIEIVVIIRRNQNVCVSCPLPYIL